MARPLRIDIPDGIYHVTSRGLNREPIVRDDVDREKWMELLGRVAVQRDWCFFAWALMGNHHHLFLRVPHGDLSAGMHDLNSGYATVFNRRHARYGPLFQGRFKGILVEERHHYWELTRYVHLNPVRAGMVARPEDYPWSSCRHYFRAKGAPEWLRWEEVLAEHGTTMRSAREAYRKFLADGVSNPPGSPLAGSTTSVLLGSERFVGKMREWLQGRLPDREVPAARELRAELPVEQVVDVVCREFRVEKEQVLSRGSRRNRPRLVAIYLCRALTRCPVVKLGEHFGGVSGQAIGNLVGKVKQERANDRKFSQALDALEETLLSTCKMTI